MCLLALVFVVLRLLFMFVSLQLSCDAHLRLFNVLLVSDASPGVDFVVWPFVNGTQWGAYVTCWAPCVSASLILPFPMTGPNTVVAAIVWAELGPFTVGQLIPDAAVLSNEVV